MPAEGRPGGLPRAALGILALGALAACGGQEPAAPAAARPPVGTRAAGPGARVAPPDLAPVDVGACDGVLVVALDSASADAFSFLGGDLPTTPRLAALAEDGLVVTDHVLATTGLNGALATLLTGQHAREHGVGSVQTLGRARLRDDALTLAEGFAARGWRTLLAAAAPQVHPDLSGFAQGFASLHVADLFGPARRADQVVGAAAPTLARWLEAGEPVFALVQLSDLDARGDRAAPGADGGRWLEARLAPHVGANPKLAAALAGPPEAAPAAVAELLQRARGSAATRAWRSALRDGRASALDAQLGRLLDLLERFGRLDRTLVVVVGLRGGVLEPPEVAAGPRLAPAVLPTPLVVRFPGEHRPRGRVDALASLVDVPRALDGLFGLRLGATAYPTTDLVALAEGRPRAGVGDLPVASAFVSSADLSLAALLTSDLHLERVAGGEDHLFHRSGELLSAAAPGGGIGPAELERFDAFAAPATLEVRAGGLAAARLEVGWRIERGLLATVAVDGAASADATAAREAARRRSGRAGLAAGGTLRLGLTDRTADVRLDLSFDAAAGRPPRDALALEAPLSRSLVPRVTVPRVVPWPADDSDAAELPLVDVQRAAGVSWRVAVNGEGPCELLLSVWPPRAPHERLEVSAGGRVVADAVPGRLDVVRLRGRAPFDLTAQKGPDEQFALAARLGDEVVDARRVRVDGRRMAGETELSLVVPGWLLGVSEGLYDAAQPDPAGWIVRRTDPAGTFGPEQALAPTTLDLVRSLPAGE